MSYTQLEFSQETTYCRNEKAQPVLKYSRGNTRFLITRRPPAYFPINVLYSLQFCPDIIVPPLVTQFLLRGAYLRYDLAQYRGLGLSCLWRPPALTAGHLDRHHLVQLLSHHVSPFAGKMLTLTNI